MVGHTPRGMQPAQEYLEKMSGRGFFLNPKMGSDLLLAAAGEKEGGYTTANYVWDLLQSRNIKPTLPAVRAYYEGLKHREIPCDDPRLVLVGRLYDDLNLRFGGRRNYQMEYYRSYFQMLVGRLVRSFYVIDPEERHSNNLEVNVGSKMYTFPKRKSLEALHTLLERLKPLAVA